MDAVKLKPGKLEMLRLLLNDPKIKSCIIVDGSYAGEILVKDNGDILLGRTKHGWINSLFNSYKEIDFFSIASKIAVKITATARESSPETIEIIKEVVDKTLIRNDREQIIDLLFQYVVLFCPDSIYYSSFTQGKKGVDSRKVTIGKVALDLGGCVLGDIPIFLDKSPKDDP